MRASGVRAEGQEKEPSHGSSSYDGTDVILIVVCLLICGTAGYLATAMQRRVRTLVFGKSRTS